MNLQKLCLNSNKFEKFPSEICGLKNLQSLSFNDNNLKEISPKIGQLRKLRWLNPEDEKFLDALRMAFYVSNTINKKCQLQNIFQPICELL